VYGGFEALFLTNILAGLMMQKFLWLILSDLFDFDLRSRVEMHQTWIECMVRTRALMRGILLVLSSLVCLWRHPGAWETDHAL
jgi:hypothetical protein